MSCVLCVSYFLPLISLKLQEFGSKYEAETLRNPKKTDLADVIVYVHDSSDTNSFSYISNLRVCQVSPLFSGARTRSDDPLR